MRRMLAVLALACTLPVALPAGQFHRLVQDFARESGTKQTHIPFFWLARFVVAVSTPAGTSGLHLAVFEHPGLAPQGFLRLTNKAVAGRGWTPIIRVRSRNRETTNIYARQKDRQHLQLLIATLDNEDATFVEVRIRPQKLIRFVDDRRKNAEHTGQ
ncbi:MAG TPA: hypothetical protein VF283_03550 [Bryobacteraceae bacterium]